MCLIPLAVFIYSDRKMVRSKNRIEYTNNNKFYRLSQKATKKDIFFSKVVGQHNVRHRLGAGQKHYIYFGMRSSVWFNMVCYQSISTFVGQKICFRFAHETKKLFVDSGRKHIQIRLSRSEEFERNERKLRWFENQTKKILFIYINHPKIISINLIYLFQWAKNGLCGTIASGTEKNFNFYW